MTERERYIHNVNKIYNALSQTELLAQFAEECTEAAHAALKLRRVMLGRSNPAEVSREDANLLEKYADLSLCWRLLDVSVIFCMVDMEGTEELSKVMYRKAERWQRRLEGQS